MSRNNAMGARNFLMGFGLLYVVLSAYRLIVGVGSAANFLSLNAMGHWSFMMLGRSNGCRRLADVEASGR